MIVQLLGGVALVLVMPVLETFGVTDRWNNCWWYAVNRWYQYGGYVVMQRSFYGWWFHFWHTFDFKTGTEWTTAEKHERAFPPLIFRGYVRTFHI